MDWDLFENIPVFYRIERGELKKLFMCLKVKEKTYTKDEYIYRAGDMIDSFGIITSGSANLLKDDAWGNAQILDHIGKGQIFAETYACIGTEPLMINVQASEETTAVFFNIRRLLEGCCSSCSFQGRLVRNLLQVMAQKNLNLTRKIDLITPKSIRERIMTYLSGEAVKQGQDAFRIPFNRQQMADYLSVDRSALSKELSKLKNDGFIDFKKDYFILKR